MQAGPLWLAQIIRFISLDGILSSEDLFYCFFSQKGCKNVWDDVQSNHKAE